MTISCVPWPACRAASHWPLGWIARFTGKSPNSTCRAAQEGGRIGDLFRLDATQQGRPLRGVLNHLVDVADGPGGARGVGTGGNQIDADLLGPEVARQLLGIDLQGSLGRGHAAAVVW